VHKTDVGGVRLALDDATAVRRAFEEMRRALGERMGDALVQPTVADGVELIAGVTHDPIFGPLVLFGMGGMTAELVRDTALRLVPLTEVDAHDMVRSLRTSPLLFGYRNTPEVNVEAIQDVLLRVSRLVEDLPEIAELDCNPIVVSAAGAVALDVKIHVAPYERRTRSLVDS
jgi:acyl-CoA synthetase (NDP forming)